MKKRRMLSCLMAVAMAMTMLPATALASEEKAATTIDTEINQYWHDYSAAIVGKESADETVATLKAAIGGTKYDTQIELAIAAYCVEQLITGKELTPQTVPTEFVGTWNGAEDMTGYTCVMDAKGISTTSLGGQAIGQSQLFACDNNADGSSGIYHVVLFGETETGKYTIKDENGTTTLTFTSLIPEAGIQSIYTKDTSETSSEGEPNETSQPADNGTDYDSKYNQYWHDYCAAIVGTEKADATVAELKGSIVGTTYDTQIESAIAAFCVAQLITGKSPAPQTVPTEFVGTWDGAADNQMAGFTCAMDTKGTSTTYFGGEMIGQSQLFAYDNDEGNAAGIYNVLLGGATETGKYTIVTDGGVTTLTFTSLIPSSGDQSVYVKRNISDLTGTYKPLFEGTAFESKYDPYWHDYSASIVGAAKADETVTSLKSSVGNGISSIEQASQEQFYCGFTQNVATITFDGNTISGSGASGQLFSHTYQYSGTALISGTVYDIYETSDNSDDEFKYFLIAPDTTATTYHIEFRYGSDLEKLKKLDTDTYANWMASGISTNADDTLVEKAVALFCIERLLGSNPTPPTPPTEFIGTWDGATKTQTEGLSCVMDTTGTITTSYNGTAMGQSKIYAYDSDPNASAGIYNVVVSGVAETGRYTIVTAGSTTTLTFTSVVPYAGDQSIYVKKISTPPSSGSSSDSDDDSGSSSSGVNGTSTSTTINTSSGTVSSSDMSKAVNQAAKGSTITIAASGSAKATLPASGLTAAANKGNGLTVTNQQGGVTLSAAAITGLVDGISSDAKVTLGVEKASASAAGVSEGTPVFNVSVTVGSTAVHSFDGTLTIALTVSNLSKITDPHLLHILDDNTREYLTPSVKGNTLTVSGIRNLSYFAVIPGSEVPTEMPFTDVADGAYYHDAVQWAYEKEITGGTNATTFSPNATCTRAQVVTFLWRAMGCPEPTTTSIALIDVSADAYYYKAVLWAIEKGITNGTSATTFAPDATVTRSQTVTFQYRAAGSPAVTAAAAFTDVPTDAYYANAVAWAASENITSGTGSSTFSPHADCTRGQIVTFLYRQLGD